MKIGVVSNFFPPNSIGGYERLCADVVSELQNVGHDVRVLTSDYGSRNVEAQGVVVERTLRLLADYNDIYRPIALSSEQRVDVEESNQIVFSEFSARNNFDVLFLWNLYFLGNTFIEHISSTSKNIAVFLTDNWLIAAKSPNSIGQFFSRFVHGEETFDQSALLSTNVVALEVRAMFGSQFVRSLYQSCGFRFSHECVLHNGARIPITGPFGVVDRAVFRSSNTVKLLFAGRIVDVKGLHVLVEALPAIKRELPKDVGVQLDIVGDAQDKEYLKAIKGQIALSGLGDLVRFHDPVPEWLLSSVFNEHDIYIFPSLYEPFSLTLIHALAAGIPTVASAVGGNTEIITNERSGLLYPRTSASALAVAVVQLIRQPQLRAKLAEEGMRIAKRFSFHRMVRRIETQLLEMDRVAETESK